MATLAHPSARTTTAQLLDYGLRVRALGPAELQRTYSRLSAENQAQPSDVTSIKLSLLLSNPGASFYDPQRAIRLLDAATRDLKAKRDPLATFPQLLDRMLHERQQVARRNDALTTALAAERARNQELSDNLAKARTDLAAERAHGNTLQKQLNALKTLEQQINHDDLSQ